MKFDGRQLHALGCPQDKIKFFVGKEFDSEEALKTAISEFKATPTKTEEEKLQDYLVNNDIDAAINIVKELGCLPYAREKEGEKGVPSKAQLRRWLDSGSCRINGAFPKSHTHVNFPITDLVWFPGSVRQTTFI